MINFIFFEISSPRGMFGPNMSDSPNWSLTAKSRSLQAAAIKRSENRIAIPTAARREMLKRIYVGPMGIVKCKNQAKAAIFFPNMHSHIDDVVSNCPTCLQFRISNPKEPLISHDVPENRWQIVAADLF